MKNFKYVLFIAMAIYLISPFKNVKAEDVYYQTITLRPGWNIVSTPRVVDFHQFSATENSTNFDIYILDPSKESK